MNVAQRPHVIALFTHQLLLFTIILAAPACAGSTDQGKVPAPSTQVDVTLGTGGRGASGGTTGTSQPNVGGSITASGGAGTTSDFAATGGTSTTASSGAGGASTRATGGQPSTSCPDYAPSPGNSCAVTTVCTYTNSSSVCATPRTTRARCTESRWIVDVPMDCAQDLSNSNCAIDGTWRLVASGDGGGVRGVPYDITITVSHDSTRQYYVTESEITGFSGFGFSSQNCTLQADYRYQTIIPPANGSNCGLVSTECEYDLAFSNGTGSGTLTCTGHPNTCVGVYGGNAVLQVKATRVNSGD